MTYNYFSSENVKNLLVSILSAILFLIGSVGFAADESNVAVVTKANPSIDGGKIYRENCAICHGDAGDGNTRAKSGLRPPPRNFTTIESALELTRDRMIKSVRDGRPGTGMMPHKDRLSGEEIVAVVDYVRQNFMYIPEKGDKLVKNVEGEKVYSKYCSVCHGDKGNTAVWAKSGLNPQPRNFTTAESRKILTRERMIDSVTNGRPGTAMQPHSKKLTKKEIASVVEYIREAFMQGAIDPVSDNTQRQSVANMHVEGGGHSQIPGYPPVSQSAKSESQPVAASNPHQGMHMQGMPVVQSQVASIQQVDMSAPMPKGLSGDVSNGREFYMNNCFACHGKSGEGNGPRAHFNTPRPRNFTSEASRRMLNRERLFSGITNGKVGTVMPAWGKVLSEQQIADVAEFVFQSFVVSNDTDKNVKKKQPPL